MTFSILINYNYFNNALISVNFPYNNMCFVNYSWKKTCHFLNSLLLQNALKFHRTKFSGRQINIEVTCGGGGRGEERRTKIKKRNEKFFEKYETKKASEKAKLK